MTLIAVAYILFTSDHSNLSFVLTVQIHSRLICTLSIGARRLTDTCKPVDALQNDNITAAGTCLCERTRNPRPSSFGSVNCGRVIRGTVSFSPSGAVVPQRLNAHVNIIHRNHGPHGYGPLTHLEFET